MKAVTDCFLIYLHQDDVKQIADCIPEFQARLKTFRNLGQRRARDYSSALSWLNLSDYPNKELLPYRGVDLSRLQTTAFFENTFSVEQARKKQREN